VHYSITTGTPDMLAHSVAEEKPLNFLVTDYDGCALRATDDNGQPNPHPHLMSTALMTFAREFGFVAFYGCTHRTVELDLKATLLPARIKKYLQYRDQQEFNPAHLLTTAVTQHIEDNTGLPCMAVSTPDDDSTTAPREFIGRCGYGYKHMMTPYEAALVKHNPGQLGSAAEAAEATQIHNVAFLPSYPHRPVKNFDAGSKNRQLIQIAHHARRLHPDKPIVLHYFDDMPYLCEAAARINPLQLPHQVTLHIYHYQYHKTLDTHPKATVTGKHHRCDVAEILEREPERNRALLDYLYSSRYTTEDMLGQLILSKQWDCLPLLLKEKPPLAIAHAAFHQLLKSAIQKPSLIEVSNLIGKLQKNNLLQSLVDTTKSIDQLLVMIFELKDRFLLLPCIQLGIVRPRHIEALLLRYAKANHSSNVRLLLSLRPDFQFNINVCNSRGKTAFNLAEDQGNITLCQQLIAAGADTAHHLEAPTLTRESLVAAEMNFRRDRNGFFSRISAETTAIIDTLREEKDNQERHYIATQYLTLHPQKAFAQELKKTCKSLQPTCGPR
jgi:ankyrin repeat protein